MGIGRSSFASSFAAESDRPLFTVAVDFAGVVPAVAAGPREATSS